DASEMASAAARGPDIEWGTCRSDDSEFKVGSVYYEKKEKFKWKIKEFFEKDVKDKLIKLELKTFIGTKFQIING
ncbi:hypothetical protein, partial [Athalassotoga sp.]|uniref:hypothetical protein n=1 Tax=Athalassotoga sp. TaxID=2022597 RepID=UPI003CFE67A4